MSSYHSSFTYLDKNSSTLKWIITHFEPDNGEQDSGLSQEQKYTESSNGIKRNLYGTRWNSVVNLKITVIKEDKSEFTIDECREAYRWLTGNPEADWLDLYIDDVLQCRLLCTIQDVKPQKLDSKTIGLNIYCESLSPWAYSPIQTVEQEFDTVCTITIKNESDDMYSFVYPKITYQRIDDSAAFAHLTIDNLTTGEKTEITDLAQYETITLSANQIITSGRTGRTFGNTFNYVWPRFKAGTNELTIAGRGKIKFEYIWPIKIVDMSIYLNESV